MERQTVGTMRVYAQKGCVKMGLTVKYEINLSCTFVLIVSCCLVNLLVTGHSMFSVLDGRFAKGSFLYCVWGLNFAIGGTQWKI